MRALGASLGSAAPRLVDLRIANNRLRTSGALALVDALVGSRAPLAILDLSGTELAGGTVSLPRLFGERRAYTAKLADQPYPDPYPYPSPPHQASCARRPPRWATRATRRRSPRTASARLAR